MDDDDTTPPASPPIPSGQAEFSSAVQRTTAAKTMPNGLETQVKFERASELMTPISTGFMTKSSTPVPEARCLSEQSSTPGSVPKGMKRKAFYLTVPDGDDDSEGFQIPGEDKYDPSTWVPPQTSIRHPSFSKAEGACMSIPQMFLDILDNDDHHNYDTDFIRERSRALACIQYPGDVVVGLTGVSGSGKSSLINSILSMDEVAMKGDSGSACTSVVQEFRRTTSANNTAFEAEVELLSSISRKSALAEYFKDFWDFQQVDQEAMDDEFDEANQPYVTCLEVMVALFCDHDECIDREAVEEFLRSGKGPEDSSMLTTLNTWLDTLISKLSGDSSLIKLSASTLEDLQEKVEPFVRSVEPLFEGDSPRPSLWPMVRVIRTYLDAPLLREGIVLVDMPGNSDTNRTRTQASNACLRDVEITVVVAAIDRVETDANVYSNLMNAHRRRRRNDVFMVATNSDGIDLNIQSTRPPVGIKPGISQKVLDHRKGIREVLRKIEEARKGEMQARRRGGLDLEREHVSKRDELEVEKKLRMDEYSEYYIRKRNERVVDSLKKKYKVIKKLQVFSVSNTAYKAYIDPTDVGEPPNMKLETTGILDLKGALYKLPAGRKYDALKHRSRLHIDNFLNVVEMTCSQSKLKRKENIDTLITSPLKDLESTIEEIYKGFQKEVIDPLLSTIKASRNAWIGDAEDLLKEWTSWNDRTHKAFCIRDGYYKHKLKGWYNWNEKLTKNVGKTLAKQFRTWEQASQTLAQELCEALEKLVINLRSQLEATAGISSVAFKPFFGYLANRKLKLPYDSEKAGDKLEFALQVIREKISGFKDQSYFTHAMLDIYKQSALQKGKGSFQKRRDVLEKKIKNKTTGPYAKIYQGAKADCDTLIHEHIAEMYKTASEFFEDIPTQFHKCFESKEDDSLAARDLKKRLLSQVPAARSVLENEVSRYLEECRAAGP